MFYALFAVLLVPAVAFGAVPALGVDPALVIGATISASTFGSPACIYSDATVLTAKAAGCTPLQHALTRFPYALIAAAATVLGYLVVAWI
jgi:Na+/H+ antiporter NhaC